MSFLYSIFKKLPYIHLFIFRDFLLNLIILTIKFSNIFIKPLKEKDEKLLKEEVKNGRIKRVLVNGMPQIGDAIVFSKVIKALEKHFEYVEVLATEKNCIVYANENLKFRIYKGKLFLNNVIVTNIWLYLLGLYRLFIKNKLKENYDLIIDMGSMPSVCLEFNAKYIIGENKGPLSLFYTTFYPTPSILTKKTVLESKKEAVEECLGIKLEISDKPPEDFIKEKEKKIFIFVGNKPNRNLSHQKWKEIILIASKFAPVIVADDPLQLIINKLIKDEEITKNPKITIIKGERTFNELAEIVNKCFLLIALDGGAQHWFERYTNALVLYTCGLPYEWKPYSKNPYKKHLLNFEHVFEETITSANLKKGILYIEEKRERAYDFLCKYKPYFDFRASEIEKAIGFFFKT